VRHADGKMLVNPKSDLVLRAGDTLIALGRHDDLERLGHNHP
jgi:K+/H+ antiporter YhaU regulatory subunit KhtT